MITYKLGNDVDLDAVIDVYRSSTLGKVRPIDDRGAMDKMLRGANLVVTAWDGDKLVGIARSLSDFGYCTYLSDLAVTLDYQRRGIGRELVRRTQKAGMSATVFLFAVPTAEEYYEKRGFSRGSGWFLSPLQRMR